MSFLIQKLKRKRMAGFTRTPERESLTSRAQSANSRLVCGFSIVEALVSLLAFSLIVGSVALAFVQILNIQRRGFGAQKVQENTMFMFEMLAREVRVSLIENQDSPVCDIDSITMIHPVNGTVVYAYDPVNKTVTRTQGVGTPESITSDEVQVNRFNFCVIGSTVDDQQVRVGVILQMQNRGALPQNTTVFDLQTTVTSRDITTEYQN